jgi:RND family efflux transporter MFP subunit
MAALVILVLVVGYNLTAMQPMESSPGGNPGSSPASANPLAESSPNAATTATSDPDVSVIWVEASSYQAQVAAFGAVKPRYSLTLTAQVAGQVQTLAAGFESGHRLKDGDLLMSLEQTHYQAEVATAQYDLTSARQSLLEEKREAIQAKAEWRASGLKGKPESALVLHQPQLATAQAALTKAEAALANAKKDLERTQIRAPFDALVVERKVAPGSYVQVGTELATLYPTERVEVPLALSARDWRNLPAATELESGRWPATLISVETGEQWPGHILRLEQHLDGSTRQRSLILAVDQPLDQSPPLLPGSFVEGRMAGRKVSGLWQLPSSALSQRGAIWYLDAHQHLANFTADVVFADKDHLYVRVPPALAKAPQQVLVHPLNAYLVGMKVHPLTQEPAK